MKVTVTAEDIAKGVRMSRCECPIAQAICRIQPFTPIVGHEIVLINMEIWELPPEARGRIAYYDGTGEMEPFEFELVGPK